MALQQYQNALTAVMQGSGGSAINPQNIRNKYKTNQWAPLTRSNLTRSGNNPFKSIMSRGAIEEQLEARAKKYGAKFDENKQIIRGTMGVSRMMAVDEDKLPIPFAPMELNGVSYRAGSDGMFRVVDEQFMEEELKLAEERDAVINKLTKLAMASDEAAAIMLFDGDTARFQELAKGNNKDVFLKWYGEQGGDVNIPHEVANANASPMFLQAIDSDTSVYGLGVSKLKIIVGSVAPILSNMSKNYNQSKEDTPNIK